MQYPATLICILPETRTDMVLGLRVPLVVRFNHCVGNTMACMHKIFSNNSKNILLKREASKQTFTFSLLVTFLFLFKPKIFEIVSKMMKASNFFSHSHL